MVRVMINSGLGNQMFQYAFAMGLANKRNDVICDISLITDRKIHHGEQIQNIFENITVKNNHFFAYFVRMLYYLLFVRNSRFVRKLLNLLSWDLIMDEQQMNNSNCKNLIYLGYWQSHKFFPSESFMYCFKKSLLSETTKKLGLEILAGGNKTVSIHVRRGDYLNYSGLYGGICTIDYYNKAISHLCSKIESPMFYVFSDDLDWVKTNIEILKGLDVIFVDFNQGEDSWQDMYLMSLCSHNIIANSTFSWWGAWLNTNPNKIVITPDKKIHGVVSPDFVPEEWIKIGANSL